MLNFNAFFILYTSILFLNSIVAWRDDIVNIKMKKNK